jgi:hypothetical protein
MKKRTLTEEDLKKIWIRIPNSEGLWINTNCYEASHSSFNRWARSRMSVLGESAEWPYEERIRFCQILWDSGELHMLE